MKKNLAVFLILILILTGCNEQKNQATNNNFNEPENNENTNINKEENNNSDIKEETTEDTDKNENTTVNKEENNNSDIKEETTEDTNKNENISNSTDTSNDEQSKEDNDVKNETPSCTPKKFDNTYSYIYTTKDECVSKGNDAFMNVSENIDDTIFSYGCKEIVDDCGTVWYGVYFSRWAEDGVIRVYH